MDQTGKVWGGWARDGSEGGGAGGREGDSAAHLPSLAPHPRAFSHCPSTCYGKQEDPQLKPGMFQGATSTFSSKSTS